MAQKPHLRDISFIQASKTAEMSMAFLYETLERRVGCSKKLWRQLAHEERAHSYRFDRLMKAVVEGDAIMDPRRHQTKQVVEFYTRVQARTRTWDKWGVSRKEAFEFAIKMEANLVESRIFIPRENDSERIREMLWEIREDSNDHMERIVRERNRKDPSVGIFKYVVANVKALFGR